MIQLTRLNNKSLTVNSDLIKFIEQAPDTLITLITGEKIVVRETVDEILMRIVQFRRAMLQGPAMLRSESSPESGLEYPASNADLNQER